MRRFHIIDKQTTKNLLIDEYRGQEETLAVGEPFREYCGYRGWDAVKIHGGPYQKGLPDYYYMHAQYGQRWVETKLLRKDDRGNIINIVHFTTDQLKVFPRMLSLNVGIWVIAANNLVNNKLGLEAMYLKLFSPHNCYDYLANNKFLR